MEISIKDLEDLNMEGMVVGHILLGSKGKLFNDGKKWLVVSGDNIISQGWDFNSAIKIFKHINKFDKKFNLIKWMK